MAITPGAVAGSGSAATVGKAAVAATSISPAPEISDALLELLELLDRHQHGPRLGALRRADDTLPKRLTAEPMPDGPAKGHMVEQLDMLLDQYYEVRGWDKATGKPSPEKLKELGLENVIPDLWK